MVLFNIIRHLEALLIVFVILRFLFRLSVVVTPKVFKEGDFSIKEPLNIIWGMFGLDVFCDI